MGLPEGKILTIDMVPQNRLITIKIMKFNVNLKKIGSRVLGATPRGLPLKTKF